jgi:hypothetical protein
VSVNIETKSVCLQAYILKEESRPTKQEKCIEILKALSTVGMQKARKQEGTV